MTLQELAALPKGSIVSVKDLTGTVEEGEVVQAGQVVHIMWPETKCTSVIDTKSKTWESFVVFLEAE